MMQMETGPAVSFYAMQNLEGFSGKFWLDGTDEQEDELDDVHKGILDAPTDDEGPGEICESNKGDVALETEDEAGG